MDARPTEAPSEARTRPHQGRGGRPLVLGRDDLGECRAARGRPKPRGSPSTSSTMPMRPAEHSDGDRSTQNCARTAERRVLARRRSEFAARRSRIPSDFQQFVDGARRTTYGGRVWAAGTVHGVGGRRPGPRRHGVALRRSEFAARRGRIPSDFQRSFGGARRSTYGGRVWGAGTVHGVGGRRSGPGATASRSVRNRCGSRRRHRIAARRGSAASI